jgi:alpha-tubulin suppressor-like RCC1 family protein
MRALVLMASGCSLELSPLDFACALDADCGDGTTCVDGRCGTAPRCGDAVVALGEDCDAGPESEACVDCRVQFGFACSGGAGDTSACEPNRYASISGGLAFACALTMDGFIECTGRNTAAGEDTGQATPPNALGPFHGLALGGNHGCAIRDADDRAVCWGDNRGRTSTAAGQAIVPEDLGPIASISPGETHTCARDAAGHVTCWGEINGQPLGTPNPIPPDFEATELAAASFHTCALDARSEIRCWGASDRIDAPPGPFALLEAGWFHTCAIDTARRVACWGKDSTDVRRTIPPDEADYVALSSGHYHNCAVRTDGRVRCWGTPPPDAEHRQGDPPPGTFRAVTAGGLYTCGLREGGELECWGRIEPKEE